MSRSPAVQFYGKDWLAKTQHLTLSEEGLYHRLWVYARCVSEDACSIPGDEKVLRRIARCPANVWSRAWPHVRHFWKTNIDSTGAIISYTHERLKEEAEKQSNWSAAQRDRANKGWAKRRAPASDGQSPGIPRASNGQCPEDALQFASPEESNPPPPFPASRSSTPVESETDRPKISQPFALEPHEIPSPDPSPKKPVRRDPPQSIEDRRAELARQGVALAANPELTKAEWDAQEAGKGPPPTGPPPEKPGLLSQGERLKP